MGLIQGKTRARSGLGRGGERATNTAREVLRVRTHSMPRCGAWSLVAAGNVGLVASNVWFALPAGALLARGYLAEGAFVGVGGAVSLVFHSCMHGYFCGGLARESLDRLDFLFACNLAVVVAFVLNRGGSTAAAAADVYRCWLRVREVLGVSIFATLVILSFAENHRTVMPRAGGAIGVAVLLAFFPRHVAGDPALKAHYTRNVWWMLFAAALLLGSLSLLHARGEWFRLTHTLWHTNVAIFMGVVALSVPSARAQVGAKVT